MKKTLKVLLAVVITPIALFLILTLLLYCPPVQKWAVEKAAQVASEKTGMRITVEQLRLSFPLDLRLQGLKALQPNDSLPGKTDTIADVRSLTTHVQMLPLLSGRVEVDWLTFKGLRMNTDQLIGDLRIKADLERLHLVSHGVSLGEERAKVNLADIRGGYIDVALGDTMPKDTAKKEVLWKIDVDRLQLAHTDFRLHLPGDTMSVKAHFGEATARRAVLQLKDNTYKVGALDWHDGALAYDQNFVPRAKRGFDAAHISLSDLHLGIDSFCYAANTIDLRIRAAHFAEQSGMRVNTLKGTFHTDSTRLALEDFHLTMPETDLKGTFRMDMNAFADRHPGQMLARLAGHTALGDLRPFLASLPADVVGALPKSRITVKGQLTGNLQRATLQNIHLRMDRHFDLTATGRVENLTATNRLRADLRLKGRTEDLDFAYHFLPREVREMVRLPKGIGFNGSVGITPSAYTADLRVTEGSGWLHIDGAYYATTAHYDARLEATHFDLSHFLPTMELGVLTGHLTAEGRGTDVLSPRSTAIVRADIRQMSYGDYTLDGIRADLQLHKGRMTAKVDSRNPMVGGKFGFSGRVDGKRIDGHFRGQIAHADLARLGVKDYPFVLSGYADVEVGSNLKNTHYIQGPVSHLRLTSREKHAPHELLNGSFDVMAQLKGNQLEAQLKGQLEKADLKGLGLVDKAYNLQAETDISVRSNLGSTHSVRGSIDRLLLTERRDTALVRLLAGDFSLDAGMRGKTVEGRVGGQVAVADLYQLGLTEQPLALSTRANLQVFTDQKDELMVKGLVGDLLLHEKDQTLAPGDLSLDVLSRRDTTHADITGGDFQLDADFEGSYSHLAEVGTRIAETIKRQTEERVIDQKALLSQLPNGHFILNTGTSNFISQLLRQSGYAFRAAQADITSSPETGINGFVSVDSLVYQDNVTIDMLNINLQSDGSTLNYDMAVSNLPSNSYPYSGQINGSFFEKGLVTHAVVKDKEGKTGLDLGLRAAMEGNGVKLDITSPTAILGYKAFDVNKDNYVYLGQDSRVSAKMILRASDGTGVQLYSNDADTTVLQDVTLAMHQFELEKVLAVLPFAPKISGTLNGDYHVVQTESDLTVSGDMTIHNFIYENAPMGNVGAEVVYMPKEDGSHYVDAIIRQDDEEVGTLTGTYKDEGKGLLDAELAMNQFPLHFVNGFVPDQIVGLQGAGEGTLSLYGPLDQLDINGELYLDSTRLVSVPYGVSMRFADDPVTIEHSRLKFENFEMFANNDRPLNIQGYLDFSDFNKMYLDVRMRADNFQIIDAKENARSEAYGKAFVNFRGLMRGPLNNLWLGGKIDVLGATDMAYVMRDAQLTSDSELDNLVQFSNFSDTIPETLNRPDITGLNMNLNVNVDEQARIVCYLTADHSNYIDLIGGGTLFLIYDPTNELQLRGRYTLSNGEMKYSLPIIPLRTFQIQDGSYIQWTGNPMKPTLNITATEDVKTAVASSENSQGRIVDFDCGVKLSKTFPDMGVEFVIDAPEDAQMRNELNMKSAEERSKLAVSMLASGMYLDSNVGNFAMNSALASFLQTEVNKITGSAFRSMGLDLTANLESTADATGALHTDYTFKFSKRILNNRLRISMGGRVSTGATAADDNGAYFDNFSLEYRLNQKETQYLKLYYEREAYDWLEGNISVFGGGFSWRRKLRHFKDIFKLKSDDDAVIPVIRTDSTQRKLP